MFNWAEIAPSVYSWEFLGFITGILSVLLLLFVKQKRLMWTNWLFSIASAAIYTYLFYKWQLYGNFALQPLFIAISVWGAWYWRGQLSDKFFQAIEVPYTYCTTRLWTRLLTTALFVGAPVAVILAHYGDLGPYGDALIFTVSLVAIYLQLMKYVQSWYLWILVDLIAVPFHAYHDRYATALLYLGYMIMCFFGWWSWRKIQKSAALIKPAEKLEVNQDFVFGT
jgi:nicotinamide mononucleotide transporter